MMTINYHRPLFVVLVVVGGQSAQNGTEEDRELLGEADRLAGDPNAMIDHLVET